MEKEPQEKLNPFYEKNKQQQPFKLYWGKSGSFFLTKINKKRSEPKAVSGVMLLKFD